MSSKSPARDNLDDYPETKRGRGRLPGFRMSDAHRVKIQNSNIITALLKHVGGKQEMSATQVTAGLGLLKKVLPDLQAVTISGDATNPVYHDHKVDLSIYSDADLGELARILGRSPKSPNSL